MTGDQQLTAALRAARAPERDQRPMSAPDLDRLEALEREAAPLLRAEYRKALNFKAYTSYSPLGATAEFRGGAFAEYAAEVLNAAPWLIEQAREAERLRTVEAVALKILARWDEQAARSVVVQEIATRARAAKTDAEREAARAELRRLDRAPRVSDFGDLRAELAEAFA